jgi:hypothetical protein
MRLLDPTPALLEYALKTRSFVNGFKNTEPNEGHLNETGHRLVGEFVSNAICGFEFSSRKAGGS